MTIIEQFRFRTALVEKGCTSRRMGDHVQIVLLRGMDNIIGFEALMQGT
jgi:hypothetical protein